MKPSVPLKISATSHKKTSQKITNTIFAYTKKVQQCCVIISTMVMVSVAYGNPVLNNVSSGNVTVTQSASTTVVNQSSQQAIINWNSFNIAAGQKTQFVQPNSSAIALNRINPTQGASQIYGALTANGQIILINAAGIHFGPGSMVNVGGIIASTANISDADFLAGKYIFNSHNRYAGTIINEGTLIAANHGLIALLGSNVENNGVIKARLGSIVLGSGSKFTLDFYGDQLINFAVDKAATNGGTIKNTGKLLADGGQILVTADTAQGVLDNSIDMGGVAEANAVSEQGGVIILSANGNVDVSGKLSAAGKKNATTGGTIEVLGQNITLDSSAVLNVNGNSGGGEILVGGNAHGAGPEPDALTTTVNAGALLTANASSQGNGGDVIVWSNNATQFSGTIAATGGALNGNGGYVETSGEYLNIAGGAVNLLAPHGTTGTWLLDPADLTICAACSTTASNSGNTYSPNGTNSTLLVSDLTAALSSANVTLQTTSSGTGGSGDIFVDAPVTWSSASTLTLSAYNRIFLNADITASNGGLVLSAANMPQSITSGSETALSSTGVTANVAVNSFNLAQGQWYQVAPTLPNFSATDFELNAASGSVQFIRALGGTGASSDPYLLTDIYGVQGINSSAATLGMSYQLANNIDASGTANWNGGAGFAPIGNNTNFSGTFNGQDYTINAYFSTQNGLFAATTSAGVIENVGMTNATVALTSLGTGNFGLLVGINSGTLSNASSNGTLTNTDSAGSEIFGGLVGQNNGSISGSSSTSTVTNSDSGSGSEIFGGLVGQNNGAISASTANSTITNNDSAGIDTFGGLVGQNNGTIQTSNSISTLNNSDSGGAEVFGGLVGQNNGAVTTSYSNSNVTSNDRGGSENFGGLVGQNFSTISNSYSIGNVSNQESLGGSELFGGLVGQNFGDIDSTYSTANMTNTDSRGSENFATLVGYNGGSISNSYSNGTLSNIDSGDGAEAVGGLVGINTGSISSSYSSGKIINNDTNGVESLGGLVGLNSGTINNTYSMASVSNADNGNGQEDLGGLVGSNMNGGSISNAFSTGVVSNGNPNGGEVIGGLTGVNIGEVTNAFWDMDTSGVTTSSSGTGEHTASLMVQSTFCPSGNCSGSNNYFDFTNTWGIIPGDGVNPNGSYPYLLALDTTTPRVISGFIPGGSPSATGLAGNTVVLGVNGSNVDSVTSGNNGFYYFLEQNGAIADNTPFITYLTGTTKANIVSDAPANGGSLTLLDMSTNTILVGGGTANLAGAITVDPTVTISNSDLGSAATGLPSADILYSTAGSNLTLSNSNNVNTTLQTDAVGYANTTYNINGTISSYGSETDTLNFYGPVIVNGSNVATTGGQTYHSTATVNTDTTLDSLNSGLTFATVNGGTNTMTLLANNGSITLNGAITTESSAANALVLSDGINFVNNAGSDALSAPNSRYLIYSTNPANDVLDGLTPGDKYYHSSYAANSPSSLSDQTENTVLYTIAPVLTITANNATTTYGNTPTLTYSVTGFIDGDTASVLSGSANLTLPELIDDLHVTGSPYTITASQGSLTSQNNNYGLVFVNGQLAVTPATLTVAAVGQNKVYNASTNASVTLSDNAVASDNVSVNYSSATFATKNVGTGINVTVSGISLSGTDASDYTLSTTSATTTANITPFALTINATGQNKVYDSTTNATVSLSSNVFSGDSVNLTYGTANFATKNVGTGINIAVSGISLSGTNASNYTLSTTSATTTANITPFALTVNATGQNKVYNSTTNATVSLSSNSFSGDSVNLTYGSAAFATPNAGTAIPVSVSGISLSGANANDYTINSTTAMTTANITPAALTITANNQSKVYGQTLNLGTTAFTASGLQGSDTVNSVVLTSSGANANAQVANGPYAITASAATGTSFLSSNYNITYLNGSLTVTPAALTIIANNQTKVYGAPVPTLTASYNGFVNGDTSANLTTQATLSTTATSGSAVASTPYLITASGAVDSNYTISYVTGKLTVTPASLTVSANNQNISYGQTPSTTAVSYSGFVNGDTAASLSAPGTVSATPSSDGQFHATNPSTSSSPANNSPFAPYVLTPTSGTDPNYSINYVNGNLYVSPIALNFNVPSGSHNVTVNMSSGTETISGHSNLPTEQLQFAVDGSVASTSSFLVTDVAEATITSHLSNASLGTVVGLQIDPTDAVSHTLTLSQNSQAVNADTTNILTPNSTLVPIVFGNPTTALVISGNGDNDTININSLNAAYTGTLTVNTKGGTSDVVNFNGLNGATPNTIALTASTIDLNGNINLPNSTLDLTAASAASNPESITSSGSATGVDGSINVANFDLIQGGWYQDNGNLPTFNVGNSFTLNAIPNPAVQFIRATSGNGTSAKPYVLTDVYGLEGVGSNTTTLGYNYLLGNNINAATSSHWNNGVGFIAIGNNTYNFVGTLNGQGYTVSNLYENNSANNNPAGLFGVIHNSTISNLTVTGNITGATDVGGLVGINNGGSLTNVHSNTTILGTGSNSDIGGLMGYNNGGTVNQATSSGIVAASNGTYNDYLGGLMGMNTGTVTNSSSAVILNSASYSSNSNIAGFIGYNTGTISGSSSSSTVTEGNNSFDADIAGFVAVNTGTINNSTNTGTITAGSNTTADNIAGLVSDNYGSISGSSNQGTVTLGNNSVYGYVAGFVAANDIVVNGKTVTYLGTITNSYNTGNVVGGNNTNHNSVAGLVAMNYGNISSSSNQGALISGNNNSVQSDMAGLVADNAASVVNGGLVGGNITNSYNSGAVSGDNNSTLGSMAGLVAVNNGGTITNSYNSGAITGGNSSTYGDVAGLVADNNVAVIASSSSGNSCAIGGGILGALLGGLFNTTVTTTTTSGGTISGSYNTGVVSGGNLSNQGNIAGLVAVNNGSISSSYNAGAVTGGSGAANSTSSSTTSSSGIMGMCSLNNNNNPSVTYATNGNLAGLVATNNGSITNSYNTSTGTVTGGNYASHGDLGGLVGDNNSTISNSYNLGAVTGGNNSTHGDLGGLVANNTGTISSSYNNATVSGGSNSQAVYIGGLAGNNSGTITNSENYGLIQAGNDITQLDMGGLVGYNVGLIANSTNYGNLVNGQNNMIVNMNGIAGMNLGFIINSTNK